MEMDYLFLSCHIHIIGCLRFLLLKTSDRFPKAVTVSSVNKKEPINFSYGSLLSFIMLCP